MARPLSSRTQPVSWEKKRYHYKVTTGTVTLHPKEKNPKVLSLAALAVVSDTPQTASLAFSTMNVPLVSNKFW